MTMKRLLVSIVVLLPLCWLTVGCSKAAPEGRKPTEMPSQQEMDKMLEGQRQIEMAKQKEAKDAVGKAK